MQTDRIYHLENIVWIWSVNRILFIVEQVEYVQSSLYLVIFVAKVIASAEVGRLEYIQDFNYAGHRVCETYNALFQCFNRLSGYHFAIHDFVQQPSANVAYECITLGVVFWYCNGCRPPQCIAR